MPLRLEVKVCLITDSFLRCSFETDCLSMKYTCQQHFISPHIYFFSFLEDSSFSWANAGAIVFGVAKSSGPRTGGEQGSDEEDASNSGDIHFEPIVSLPEVPFQCRTLGAGGCIKFSELCTYLYNGVSQVETKSGEEDEEILFKERAKLYRWDRDLGQWKERGVGDLKILFHPTKRFYRVLMRREQVLRVCANHTITQAMELKPMNASANALLWTATDYSGTRECRRKVDVCRHCRFLVSLV